MIAFGGNGPLHATRVARRAQVDRVLIPRDPGVGSAVGFLLAPVSFEIIRSRYETLTSLDTGGLNKFFDAMLSEAEAVVLAGAPHGELLQRRTAFMRYHGQGHEVEIELPNRALATDDVAKLSADFEAEYARQFVRPVPGMTIEILNWGVTVWAEAPALTTDDLEVTRHNEPRPRAFRNIVCDVTGKSRSAAIFDRADLRPGDRIAGPALIVEPQTTTMVSADFGAEIDGRGNIWLSRKKEVNA